MSIALPVNPSSASQLSRLCQLVAACMPALVIGYSALVDPLLNFGSAAGVQYGGVVLGTTEKSTFLTKLLMPAFMAVSIVLVMFARPVVPQRLRAVAIPGVLILMLACLSALWARAPADTLTFAAYMAILYGTLLMSVVAAGDPRRVLRCVLAMFALVVAVNLAAVMLQPPAENGHQGIYSFKNTLGAAGGCAFLFALFSLFDGRLVWRSIAWFTAIGAVVLTMASVSKTAAALMFIAPLAAIAVYMGSRVLALGPLVMTALLLAVCGSTLFFVSAILDLGLADLVERAYGDATFTGRTGIWLFVLDHIQQSPLLGNGFRGFWSLGSASPKHGSEVEFIRTIGSSHNGFLDIMLDLGLIGLVLLILLIVAVFVVAGNFKLRPTRLSLLYLAVIFFVVGRNTMESVIMWSSFFDNLSFLLVGFLACYRQPSSSLKLRVAGPVGDHAGRVGRTASGALITGSR